MNDRRRPSCQVGLAFVRRGWVQTVLRLGSLEDGTFLEPEVGFCLHGLANSGGVMEAVCRVQVRRVSASFWASLCDPRRSVPPRGRLCEARLSTKAYLSPH